MNSSSTFGKLEPLGYEQLTALSTVKPLNPPTGTKVALINCDAQNVRWRDDGTAPLAGVGLNMNTTDDPLFYTGHLPSLQFIEVAAGAVVNVSYYG